MSFAWVKKSCLLRRSLPRDTPTSELFDYYLSHFHVVIRSFCAICAVATGKCRQGRPRANERAIRATNRATPKRNFGLATWHQCWRKHGRPKPSPRASQIAPRFAVFVHFDYNNFSANYRKSAYQRRHSPICSDRHVLSGDMV